MSFIPPAGYPLSAYTPPVLGALPRPPAILAKKIDVKTGDASLLEGADPTDAALQWQLTVRQGSGAALGDNGNRLHTITKGTQQAPQQIKDEGTRIAGKFEDRGDIENVQIEGDVIGGSTAERALKVTYTNTHTGVTGSGRL